MWTSITKKKKMPILFGVVTVNVPSHNVSLIFFYRVKEKMNPFTLRFKDTESEFQVEIKERVN